jgi:uncharacterized membrane protein YphA (DoxX/SURF4 family)
VRRWIDHWNAFWFPEATTLRLSICRILVVASQLFLFFPPLADQIDLLKRNTGFIEPQLLIVAISTIFPTDMFFTPETFRVIHWVTAVAGITCLLGFATRTSAFVFALGNWIFLAHGNSYGESHHGEAIFAIFLMLLAFSPSGGSLSIDALIRGRRHRPENDRKMTANRVEFGIWPLKLIQVLLALTYFSTGASKLVYGGLQWMNGYTLQQYIFTDAVLWGLPLGIWIAQQHTLCQLSSIGTIFFELFFFITLIIPRSVPYFLISGLLFHTGIYVTMAAPFFQHMILYAVFIDFDRWQAWLNKGKLFSDRLMDNATSLSLWTKSWKSTPGSNP